MGKRERRARKREGKQQARAHAEQLADLVDGIPRVTLDAYLRTRVVCDRCGLEQPFRDGGGGDRWDVAPCASLEMLGLICDSQTARFLDELIELDTQAERALAREAAGAVWAG